LFAEKISQSLSLNLGPIENAMPALEGLISGFLDKKFKLILAFVEVQITETIFLYYL